MAANFILPYLENDLSVEDLSEAFRRYLITCIAFGIVLNRTDRATEYVLDLYNRKSSGELKNRARTLYGKIREIGRGRYSGLFYMSNKYSGIYIFR